jgi:steroid delta-isomerase-like uncharacterized protein
VNDLESLVRRRLVDDVWRAGNPDAVDAIFAPEFVAHDPDRPGLEGPDAVKRSVVAFHRAFPDFEITADDFLVADDRVVWRWTMSGTHRGPILGVDGTGRRVTITGLSLFRIRDEMMREGWIHWDALGLLRQLGALPAEGV